MQAGTTVDPFTALVRKNRGSVRGVRPELQLGRHLHPPGRSWTYGKAANKFPRVLAAAALVCGVGTLSTTGTSAGTTNSSLSINFKAIGSAKATGKTLSLAEGGPGIFLIGPNGHSLYVYNKDQGTKSACAGTCATYWPALTASGAMTLGVGIKKSEVARPKVKNPTR